jgi:hypothetical protein
MSKFLFEIIVLVISYTCAWDLVKYILCNCSLNELCNILHRTGKHVSMSYFPLLLMAKLTDLPCILWQIIMTVKDFWSKILLS